MSSFLCLSEIEEPYIFQSQLIGHESLPNTIFCVLTESYFLIFKKSSDVVSFKRLPITKKTVLYLNSQNQFSLIIGEFKFTFSSQDVSLVKIWIEKISDLVKNCTIDEVVNEYFFTDVRISRIGNYHHDFFIMIEHNDYKLRIYESLEYRRLNIITHTINLKHYSVENPTKSSSNKLLLVGGNGKFKITFKDPESVTIWRKIFLKAMDYEKERISVIFKNKSNTICADCGTADPDWISTNLCVVICENCAESHKSLGSSYSRIQNVNIYDNISKDPLLVKLFLEIGNDKANSFWIKDIPESHADTFKDENFFKEKYVEKAFIDKEFLSFSKEELENRLMASVANCDLFLTMRLWHSYSFQRDSQFVDILLAITRQSMQSLQGKYIFLQSISDCKKCIDNVLQISINNQEKFINYFLVTLMNNCISIRLEESSEIINVCNIDFNIIDLIWYNTDKEYLELSINISCQFVNYSSTNQIIDVNRLSFYSQSKFILRTFRLELLNALLPDHFVPIPEDSNLFLNCDVKIHFENPIKCKSHLTHHEIVFYYPISMAYNLKNSLLRFTVDKQNAISVRLESDQFELITANVENEKIIFDYLENIVVSVEVLRDEDLIPIAIEKMIAFIISNGLSKEGIFRIGGTIRKVDELYKLINKTTSDFTIDPAKYDVTDVVSCLKKYFRSLNEPLITNQLYDLFKNACDSDNLIDKIYRYKEALSFLPKSNFQLFRRILELFLMIHLRVDDNKMTSDNLALSTASSFITFDNTKVMGGVKIMRDLIEHSSDLFEYSEKEKKIPTPVIRSFHINPNLYQLLKIRTSESEKLSFLSRDVNYLVVHMKDIDKCTLVQDVCVKIFENLSVELWQFLVNQSKIANKLLRRLIYFNDDIHTAIVSPRSVGDYSASYFVFLPKQPTPLNLLSKQMLLCEVKLKLERYQDYTLIISNQNSLQLFDKTNRSNKSNYNFLLSDLIVYRIYVKHINKIYILHNETGQLTIKFNNNDNLEKFLFLFDLFRHANVTPL